MRWLLLPLLVALGSAPSATAAPPGPAPRSVARAPLPELGVLTTGAPGARRLRGDWEPPDLFMLVLREDWVEAQHVMVEAALPDTSLVLLSDSDTLPEGIAELLPGAPPRAVTLFGALYDSPWVRDYGPLQAHDDKGPVWLDFSYHADRWLDDQIPALLGQHLGISVEQHAVALEGGALVSDGRGLCAITDASLGDTGVSPQEPEAVDWLLGRLGCLALAVVPALPGESTGHVDMVAQFLGPDRVAVGQIDAVAFPNAAAALDQATGLLVTAAALLGRRLQVSRIPMFIEGDVHYSYVNGAQIRGAYLVPSYSAVPAALEEEAYYRLHRAVPHLELIPVPSDELIAHGGAVHCVTIGLMLKREHI